MNYRGDKHVMCTARRKTSTAASNCVGCGKCETHCPQSIAVREELKAAQKEPEGPIYKMVRKMAPWFVRF